MNKLVFRLVLPLAFIFYILFTKWWYVLPIDGTDQVWFGFPLPNRIPGANSMTREYFIFETIIDFMTYFFICYSVVFLINRYVISISVPFILRIIFTVVIGSWLILIGYIYVNDKEDFSFSFKRTNGMEVMDTGFDYLWKEVPRMDYYKYHPEKK